jgi:1-acyl-sn-glycerol-3-phosphate acyltransferase
MGVVARYVWATILLASLLIPCKALGDTQLVVWALTRVLCAHPLRDVLLYRVTRATQTVFTSLLVLLHWCYAPFSLRVTGDWSGLYGCTKSIFISNHSLYCDWDVIWMLAWHFGHGDALRIILKKSLMYMPILGWGMSWCCYYLR